MVRYDVKIIHGFTMQVIEIFLSVLIIIGLGIYIWNSIFVLFEMDWRLFSTFEEFIERILFGLIGIELLQIIRVHALFDVCIVAMLILIRKALSPDTSSIDIILLVTAVIGIVLVLHIYRIREHEKMLQIETKVG